MGRKRTHNKHLPRGVTHEHGAYYFRGRDRKRVRLGTTLGEAMARWSELVHPAPGSLTTMHAAFERYKLEVMPKKAEATQKKQLYMFPIVDAVFGSMRPDEIRPQHGYQYLAKRCAQAPTQGIKEFALVSHVLTKCVEWGAVDKNPFWQVRKGEYLPPSRDRCPSDDEFEAVYDLANERLQIAMDLALLTGLRRTGILSLDLESITVDGLLARRPGKTKKGQKAKELLFEWNPELEAVVERAKKLEPRVRRPLLCTRAGKRYTADGFSAMWQRLMGKAIRLKKIETRFTFHDIRAKSATDERELVVASERLGHSSTEITKKIYVRTPVSRVRPLTRTEEER